MANNQTNTSQNQQKAVQGSLLRRVNNTASNQNQQPSNQNNNNSLRSRLGNQNQNNNQTQQAPKPSWTVTPTDDAGVRFAYQGIGDPLFRILGTPLDKSFKNVELFVNKLENDESIYTQLVEKLNEAWSTYDFLGAVIMHPIHKHVLDAFTQPTMPIIETDTQNDGNIAQNDTSQSNPTQQRFPSYDTLRAIDPLLVLNILGRVRGGVLVEDTPLALETGFLNQCYICDDSRLVDLALATGAIEEAW